MKMRWAALGLAVWLGVTPFAAAADHQPPAEGGPLPAIRLPAPKDAGHAAYLGVSGSKDFAVAEIAAEVVIIEIFNMY